MSVGNNGPVILDGISVRFLVESRTNGAFFMKNPKLSLMCLLSFVVASVVNMYCCFRSLMPKNPYNPYGPYAESLKPDFVENLFIA